jgi:hypothetical protein
MRWALMRGTGRRLGAAALITALMLAACSSSDDAASTEAVDSVGESGAEGAEMLRNDQEAVQTAEEPPAIGGGGANAVTAIPAEYRLRIIRDGRVDLPSPRISAAISPAARRTSRRSRTSSTPSGGSPFGCRRIASRKLWRRPTAWASGSTSRCRART